VKFSAILHVADNRFLLVMCEQVIGEPTLQTQYEFRNLESVAQFADELRGGEQQALQEVLSKAVKGEPCTTS